MDNENVKKNNEISQKSKEINSKPNIISTTKRTFISEKSKSVNSDSSNVTRENSTKSKPSKPVKNIVKLPPVSIFVYATTETEIPFFISSSTSSPKLILGGGNGPTGLSSLSPSYVSSSRQNDVIIVVVVVIVIIIAINTNIDLHIDIGVLLIPIILFTSHILVNSYQFLSTPFHSLSSFTFMFLSSSSSSTLLFHLSFLFFLRNLSLIILPSP